MAHNIDVMFALIVGLVTMARVPFLDQALERFVLLLPKRQTNIFRALLLDNIKLPFNGFL